MTSFINDPEHWGTRADEAKTDRSPVCRDQEKISRERLSSDPELSRHLVPCSWLPCAAKDGRKEGTRG
jgi:hypothetical protein